MAPILIVSARIARKHKNMTPDIFKPLHTALIWAQRCADPLLWSEAVRRFDLLDRRLGELPCRERLALEERLFRMLPSDWPLWLESCRQPTATPGRALLH
jgi:hypothetical protein